MKGLIIVNLEPKLHQFDSKEIELIKMGKKDPEKFDQYIFGALSKI